MPIKESVTDDYLVCLEDGKKLKMLKRYLKTQYNMTPEDYRTKWNLPADYPMVAKSFSNLRSELSTQSQADKSEGATEEASDDSSE